MYFTTAAKPPVRGLLMPEPKRPSTTSVSLPSLGGSNSLVTSTMALAYFFFSRVRFSWQSADNLPLTLKRYAVTLYPLCLSNRVTASASPPLFPGPANTTTGVSSSQRSDIASVNSSAARSIRLMDVMGSCSIVYLSSSRIRVAENSFILLWYWFLMTQNYEKNREYCVIYSRK